MNVHSKVMIVDDRTARVGSANLSNRSMGLDTECDLVLDAELDPRLGRAIASLRNRLLAEHLDCDPQAVADALGARGSLIGAVESLRGRARSLAPLPEPRRRPTRTRPPPPSRAPAKPTGHLAFLDGLACDPEQPAPDQLLAMLVPEGLRPPVRRSLVGWGLVVAALVAVVAAWRLTPLRTLLDVETGRRARPRDLTGHPAAPLAVLGGVPGRDAGVLSDHAAARRDGAAVPGAHRHHLLPGGRAVGGGHDLRHRAAGGTFSPALAAAPAPAAVSRQLRRRGTLAVIAARMLPVGNFSLINMTAGAFGRSAFATTCSATSSACCPACSTLTVVRRSDRRHRSAIRTSRT